VLERAGREGVVLESTNRIAEERVAAGQSVHRRQALE
jgi:hypothetical protein